MARGEAELCEVAVDGGGVVGGYGTQDGGKAEVLGEGNLLPVAVCLALDGVLLSVVHIVVVGVNDPRLHHGVDSRDAFVDDDEAQGVRTPSAVPHLPSFAVPMACKRRGRKQQAS